MIAIDGGHGEGGGQVLRTALSVAAALSRAFTLERVRHNRKPPGLKAQHLECVLACASLAKARVQGAKLASNEVVFEPKAQPVPGDHRFEIKTAGATSLLLQATAFPLWLSGGTRGAEAHGAGPSEITLLGGTHVAHAPSFDDLDLGWRPLLARAGFPCTLTLERTGYYPKGGGLVRASLEPARPTPLELPAGMPVKARVLARSSSLPEHVVERLLGRARERLEKRLGVPIDAVSLTHGGPPGCAVTVALDLEGGGLIVARGLGEKGKPSERVADEACDAALADLHAGASVDEHLADQLLLPLALGAGGHYVAPRVTDHLVTNRDTLALVLPEARVSIEPLPEGTTVLVRVVGAHAAR